MLAFLDGAERTRWNGWWLGLLGAEGELFSGEHARAVADARAALDLATSIPSVPVSLYAKTRAARIFAWSGAEDEAIDVLEQLSTAAASLGPAALTRDPLFFVRLKDHAKYTELEKRLEAEVANNQSLL